MRIIFILMVLSIFAISYQLDFNNTSTYNFSSKKTYILKAKKYFKSFEKKDLLKLILNRKKYLLKHNYYFNGYLLFKKIKLHFVKAYKLNSKIYFLGVNGNINKKTVTAKEAIFDIKKENITFLKCEIIAYKSIKRRKKLVYQITP